MSQTVHSCLLLSFHKKLRFLSTKSTNKNNKTTRNNKENISVSKENKMYALGKKIMRARDAFVER